MKKKYYMPIGNWPISTGYEHIHKLLQSFGAIKSDDLESADVLVLPGGTDIGANQLRDDVEMDCVKKARESGKKIFGICRGMQFLLHSSGIPLIEHIPDFTTAIEHRTLTAHWTGESSWHTTTLGLLVNSRHHQGAAHAPTWDVIDKCEDGIIEAISKENEFGVQWHPEHPEMSGTPALAWLKQELKKRDMI